jgi:lipoyl(octanoyl) transferase
MRTIPQVDRTRGDVCEVHWLGRIAYGEAWDLQGQWATEIAAGSRPATLMLLEHPPTFTFGRRGRADHLLWDKRTLEARGVQIHWVDRGGDVTFHGPGQLVGYPLLPLGKVGGDGRLPQADYLGYVRRLEQVLIDALARLGLVTGRLRGLTGVWVQPDVASRCPRCPPEARQAPAKVAAIGVKVDAKGVSRHGFALNVDPDMSYWQGIIACGLADHASIALAQLLDPTPSMETVVESVIASFGEAFGYRMQPVSAGR